MNDVRFQTKEALRQKANHPGEDANEKGVARASKRRRWKFEKPRSGETRADGTGSLANRVRRTDKQKGGVQLVKRMDEEPCQEIRDECSYSQIAVQNKKEFYIAM